MSSLIGTKLRALRDHLVQESKELARRHKTGITHKVHEAVILATEELIIVLEGAVARLSLEDMKALTDQIRVRKERIKDL